MSQKARPNLDVTTAGWTPSAGSDHFATIDEVTADDADYTQSPSAPDGTQPLEVKLSALSDPLTGEGHKVRYRIAKNASGGAQIDVTVRLLEGATEIASWSHTNVGSSPTTHEQTLSTAEADAIGDYANLRLEWTFTQV